MYRKEPLTEEQLSVELKNLRFWNKEGASIIRELSCANFASAIGAINSIALLSEKLDHHPDIALYGFNKLRITLSTCEKAAVTDIDIDLAKQIENALFNYL